MSRRSEGAFRTAVRRTYHRSFTIHPVESGAEGGSDDVVVPGVVLGDVIGRGASSTVYLGTQERFGRPVAVKVLHLPGQSELVAKLFLNECRTLGHLTPHPNVVSVFDAGFVSPDRPYLVMEYLPGGTLADRLAESGPLPVDDVLRIGVQLAGGLHTVHLHDIVHGDVKPQNVLHSRTGEAALADFGIARLASTAGATTRAPLLTPLHAAPELFDGGSLSPRSDVYELCSTLFELLDGRATLGDATESPLLILGRMAKGARRPLDRSLVPDAVADVIESGLAPDPDDRPATALEIGERLRDAQLDLGLEPTSIVVIDPLEPTDSGDGAGSGRDAGTLASPKSAASGSAASGSAAETIPPPALRRPRRWPIAVAAVALVAVGVGLWLARDDGSSGEAAGAGSTSTDRPTTESGVPDPSWPDEAVGTYAAGLQPGTTYDLNGVRDRSSVLASDLGDPAEIVRMVDPAATAYAQPSFMVERLPARVRWQSFNASQDPACLSIVTWPITIDALWEKGATWPGHQAYLRVVELTSERDAAEVYSAFSLEQGVSADECTGFAPNPTPFDHDAIDVRHREVDIGLDDDVRHNTWIGPPPPGMTDVDSVTSVIAQKGNRVVLVAVASGPGTVEPAAVGTLVGTMLDRLG